MGFPLPHGQCEEELPHYPHTWAKQYTEHLKDGIRTCGILIHCTGIPIIEEELDWLEQIAPQPTFSKKVSTPPPATE